MRWLVLLALAAGCTHRGLAPQPSREEVPGGNPSLPAEPGAPAPPPGAPAPGAVVVPAVPPPPLPSKIKVIVRSIPPKALVFWGKKKLGETPVTLERPRDSGPVDLVVKLEGHFPLHTRAYSFRNDTVYVRMIKLEDRMTILGAKEPPPPPPAPPPPEGAPVPGAPIAPAPTPAAPTPSPGASPTLPQ